jgi:hypothetical protein
MRPTAPVTWIGAAWIAEPQNGHALSLVRT